MRRLHANLTGFLVGGAAFAICQLTLVPAYGSSPRWFLNTGAGVERTLVIVFGAALAIEWLVPNPSGYRPIWTAIGVCTAMIVYLFAIGPGNLFPIVIVMGTVMLVPITLAAGYLGWSARRYIHSIRRK